MKTLRAFLIHVHRAETAPTVAHLSRGFYIDKYNNKPGISGLRLLNLFCPFWKAFFGQATRRGINARGPILPNYCHAYRPGFRRESAMMITRIVSWTLRKVGLGSYASLKDMTNAFQCTENVYRDTAVEKIFTPTLPTDATAASLGGGTARRV